MSSRAFANVLKSFVDEAAGAFSFLTDEFGLSGPDSQTVVMPAVAFVGSGVRYRIRLDTDDRIVLTQVEKDMEGVRLIADLAHLVSAAGLGPANQVARNAQTLHNLQASLEAQAELLRQLHPIIASSEGASLLAKAGARKWRN